MKEKHNLTFFNLDLNVKIFNLWFFPLFISYKKNVNEWVFVFVYLI